MNTVIKLVTQIFFFLLLDFSSSFFLCSFYMEKQSILCVLCALQQYQTRARYSVARVWHDVVSHSIMFVAQHRHVWRDVFLTDINKSSVFQSFYFLAVLLNTQHMWWMRMKGKWCFFSFSLHRNVDDIIRKLS